MIPRRAFDIAVLGGGPAGLLAALAASKSARTAIVLRRLPGEDGPFRIDAIPARTLALLVEFGVSPHGLGVDCLHDRRGDAWATPLPRWQRAAPTAHIERPFLELALFAAVRASGRISVIVDAGRAEFRESFTGAGWQADRLIDATGRAAVTARSRSKMPQSWASRFFWLPRRGIRATPEFRIAALPEGYAYRIGSAGRIGIGVAGRGRLLKADATGVEEILRREDAGWLCEGLPPLASMNQGLSGVSSVQWAMAGRAALAGDASLARDSLSSQGLASSLSDALYAVAAVSSGDLAALRGRQAANLQTHLRYLREGLANCRYRALPLWTAYEKFIIAGMDSNSAGDSPVLREGRLAINPEV